MTDEKHILPTQEQLDAIPDRVWQMYFAPGGAIPQLQKSIKDVCTKIDKLVRKMDKYNGLMDKHEELVREHKIHKEEVIGLTKLIAEQVNYCKSVQGQKDLVAELRAQHKKEMAEKGKQTREEEWKKFKKISSIVGILLTIVGLILRYAIFAN